MAIWLDGIVALLVGETEVYMTNVSTAKAALKLLRRRHKQAKKAHNWCVCEFCCLERPDPF